MKTCLMTLGLGLLLAAPCEAAKIYKWRDANGEMHYSTTPPPEAEAESIGIKSVSKKPQAEQTKEEGALNLEGLSDKEKIRVLQERLDREKIQRLEEKIKALESGGSLPANSTEQPQDDARAVTDETQEEAPAGPDYSVQGQVRMLEEAKQREAQKTRCRAKAPHGVNCEQPEAYQRY